MRKILFYSFKIITGGTYCSRVSLPKDGRKHGRGRRTGRAVRSPERSICHAVPFCWGRKADWVNITEAGSGGGVGRQEIYGYSY